ncbi:hypothetical protein C8R48DRAFT_677288 [Suillus tomentosus]|nr:hypothetical protein C8R48DRAFT_677288 [Suillus tomentosus]
MFPRVCMYCYCLLVWLLLLLHIRVRFGSIEIFISLREWNIDNGQPTGGEVVGGAGAGASWGLLIISVVEFLAWKSENAVMNYERENRMTRLCTHSMRSIEEIGICIIAIVILPGDLCLHNSQSSVNRREAHNHEATSEGQYFPIDEYVLARAGDMPSIRREVQNCEATSEGQYFPVDEYVLARAGDMPSIRREVQNCEATSEGQYFPVDEYVLARAADMPSIRREVQNCEATSEGQYFPVDEYVLGPCGRQTQVWDQKETEMLLKLELKGKLRVNVSNLQRQVTCPPGERESDVRYYDAESESQYLPKKGNLSNK